MKTRAEAAEYSRKLFYHDFPEGLPVPLGDKTAWHFGKVELRILLDFIYEAPPLNDNELLAPRKLRNNTADKNKRWEDA